MGCGIAQPLAKGWLHSRSLPVILTPLFHSLASPIAPEKIRIPMALLKRRENKSVPAVQAGTEVGGNRLIFEEYAETLRLAVFIGFPSIIR